MRKYWRAFVAGVQAGMKERRVARLREQLVVLKIRAEVLSGALSTTFLGGSSYYHDRYHRTLEEIGLARHRLQRLGVELPND